MKINYSYFHDWLKKYKSDRIWAYRITGSQNLFIFFFTKKRPRIAEYIVCWPVEKVFHFLKYPVDQLSLKRMTIKTLALIAITTSDRGQTLNLMNIKRVHISDTIISYMPRKQKTINRVLRPKILKCVDSFDPALDVCAYAKTYMLKTSKFWNENHNDFYFFILGNKKAGGSKLSIHYL